MQDRSNIRPFSFSNGEQFEAKNYIFDSTYKSMGQKRRFENDTKYAYFNTVVKMKNECFMKRKGVFDHVFGPQGQRSHSQNKYKNLQGSLQQASKILHIEKLNNYSFKIYKDKKSLSYGNRTVDGIGGMNLKVKIERGEREKKGVQIYQILNEYNRLNNRSNNRGNDRSNNRSINRSNIIKTSSNINQILNRKNKMKNVYKK